MNTINEVINGDSNILNKEITSTIVKSKIKGVKNILPENQILIRNNHQLNDKIDHYKKEISNLIPQSKNNYSIDDEGYYECTIDNVKDIEEYKSPIFFLCNNKWKITLQRNCDGYVKLQLQLQKWNFSSILPNQIMYYNFVFSIRNENDYINYRAKASPSIKGINTKNNSIELSKFIKTEEFSKFENSRIIIGIYLYKYKRFFSKSKVNENICPKEKEVEKEVEKVTDESIQNWIDEQKRKEEITSQKKEIENTRLILKQELEEMESQKKDIENKRLILRNELEEVESRKALLNEIEMFLRQKRVKIEYQINEMEDMEFKLEQEMEEIEYKKTKIRIKKENIENIKMALNQEREDLKIQKKSVFNKALEKIKFQQGKIDDMNIENISLKNELKSKDVYIKEIEEQISQLKNQNSELKTEYKEQILLLKNRNSELITEYEGQISQLKNQNSELQTEQYKNEFKKLFIKTNNGEGNNKDFYYEWDIHNYKKFAINDFESDITASGYKWKIKLSSSHSRYLSLKLTSASYFSFEENNFKFANFGISIRNTNDFSCFVAKAPDLLQHVKIGNNNINLKKLIKKEDLLKKNPEFNNKSVIENGKFIIGIYIHLYEYNSIENDNAEKKFECSICLEKALSNTKLCVTKCGHMYCKDCIDSYFANNHNNNNNNNRINRINRINCPFCRKSLTKRDIIDIYF